MTVPSPSHAELLALAEKATDSDWEYVQSSEHHGPYVTTEYGSTIADLYTMTLPNERSTANGGQSKPIHFLHEMADANAAFIAAANPATVKALVERVMELERLLVEKEDQFHGAKLHNQRLAAAIKDLSP